MFLDVAETRRIVHIEQSHQVDIKVIIKVSVYMRKVENWLIVLPSLQYSRHRSISESILKKSGRSDLNSVLIFSIGSLVNFSNLRE